ncbi:hypothetical protein QBC39DRAFT_178961 [Podospora conica]|nr:hypothetical protein QBC39DRAFT_178961 [Schizothecium conicum]
MATPTHRHQSSLEGLIDFPTQPLFADPIGRARAVGRFIGIVGRLEAAEKASGRLGRTSLAGGNQYNRPALVRLTFEYARTPESQDRFLHAFFRCMDLDMGDDDGDHVDLDDDNDDLARKLSDFADYLLNHFFLPLRALTNKTPQPSPVYSAVIQRTQGREERINSFPGTPEARVSQLRGTCLVRDRYRCVITREFDIKEATRRYEREGPDAADDDGNRLVKEQITPSYLEVSHILPHSLTTLARGSEELDDAKKAALSILNMFDHGIIHLIEGADIDRPYNALTLNQTMHKHFGEFKVFFEPVPGAPPHTYHIGTFLYPFIAGPQIPVTRTLFEHASIDPPLPRLLAFHNAVAHILHLSGAGAYIERILDEMDKKVVREDGSTPLSHFVTLGLLMKA